MLLDSSHPDQERRGRARAVLPESLLFSSLPVSPEQVRFSRALDALRKLGTIGATRLIVMTAGQDDTPRLRKRAAARLARIWKDLQDDYASRSTDAVHLIARYSPHFIQRNLGQPDFVVQAVRELVSAAVGDRPLRACRKVFRPPGAVCVSG